MNRSFCAVALFALAMAATTFGCSDDESTHRSGTSSSTGGGKGGEGGRGGQGGLGGEGGQAGQGGTAGQGGQGGQGGTAGQGGQGGTAPVCGDLECNGGETCGTCPDDCGICPPVCGDDVCEVARENCQACAADCGECPPGTCSHALCEEGAPLLNDCDPCVSTVCANDPACCMTTWDAQCITNLTIDCGIGCGCAHDLCTEGDLLDPACNTCVAAVCAADDLCCTVGWDDLCIGQAGAQCGLFCP